MLAGATLVRTTHPFGDDTDAMTDCPAVTVIGVANDALTQPVRRRDVDPSATRRKTVPSEVDTSAVRDAMSVRDAFQKRMPVTVRSLLAMSRFPTLTGVDMRAASRPCGYAENVAPILAATFGVVAAAEVAAFAGTIPRQLRATAAMIATNFIPFTSSEEKT